MFFFCFFFCVRVHYIASNQTKFCNFVSFTSCWTNQKFVCLVLRLYDCLLVDWLRKCSFLGFLRFFFFLCNLTYRWLSELCISGITSTSLVWLAITRPQSCQSCFRLCIRARNIGTSKKTIFSHLSFICFSNLSSNFPFLQPCAKPFGMKACC